MEDPKNPQSGQTQPHLPEDEERNNPQRPGDQADRSRSGKRGQGSESNIPGKERDNEGKIGQDTDGDGNVVKPGQRPGQSGGQGLPENK
jgi:hypothetical protein